MILTGTHCIDFGDFDATATILVALRSDDETDIDDKDTESERKKHCKNKNNTHS